MIIVLDTPYRKERAIKELQKVPLGAGMEMELRVHKDNRTLAQNRRHWAMMTAVSQQMPSQMGGAWHSPESWHELFKRMFLGVEAFEFDDKIYKAPISSRGLKIHAFADFDQQIDVWMAEHGIMLEGGL